MIKSDKKLTELKKIIDGGRQVEIEEMISNLRDREPFEGVLKLLAGFYDTTGNERLRLHIAHFFNDLKENSVRSEVIAAMENVTHPETVTMLVSSCWQSGLDYSEHAVKLAEIYQKGDYYTSIECFTVLDTCSVLISESDKALIIKSLTESLSLSDSPKQLLTKELISVLGRKE